MAELLQANWILLVVALLIGIAVAWWVFAANRKTRIASDEREEPGTPARRNQALIDAPPAAERLSNPANTQEVAAARADADAEAGISVAPTKPAATQRAGANSSPGAGVASPPNPEPATPATPKVAPPAPADEPAVTTSGDDLTRIKGLGPKLQTHLNELGVKRLSQIAEWDDAEIDRIDAQLGSFQGRIRRDDWPAQARLLAAGDVAGFESRFGKT